jgi:uncharacterized phiE125 gp8 family phage protein
VAVIFDIRTVTPTAEIPLAVSLAQAKAHLRVEGDEDDELITDYLRAAQGAVERHTGQVLSPRVLRWTAAGFPRLPAPVRLWRTPVTGIVSVKYLDRDGTLTTIDADAWRWDETMGDALLPALAAEWPSDVSTEAGMGAVRVEFEAGYEDGLVEPDLLAAVKLTVASMYLDREGGGVLKDGLSPGAMRFCGPHRLVLI